MFLHVSLRVDVCPLKTFIKPGLSSCISPLEYISLQFRYAVAETRETTHRHLLRYPGFQVSAR